MPTVEEQVGTLVAEQATLVAEVIAERTTRQASVEAAEAAESGAETAQTGAETALSATTTEAANAAQSASVATAAAAALVGTEGIIPTASEILWLNSKSQAGVNALGFFDTGARLLSGVSERALLRYGEDNDTLNFLLDFPTTDGFRLDFTDEGTVFTDAAGTTPATAGDSLARVNDVSGNAVNASQASAALCGKFGKAPKVARNLFINSEDFLSDWAEVSVSAPGANVRYVALNHDVSYDGNHAAHLFVESNNFDQQRVFSVFPNADGVTTFALDVKSVGRERLTLRSTSHSGVRFDLTNGTYVVNTPVDNVSMTALGNGWYRCLVSADFGSPGSVLWLMLEKTSFGGSYEGDGASGVLVARPEFDIGQTDGAYQTVGASDLDVTESGVQSFGFWRPDLSDDVLPLTVPAIDGDIVIAGKDGIHIAAVTVSAGAFSVGPTTYTGGAAGVLSDVGDVVGIDLIDKTMSDEEKARLIAYYQGRGAGEVIE